MNLKGISVRRFALLLTLVVMVMVALVPVPAMAAPFLQSLFSQFPPHCHPPLTIGLNVLATIRLLTAGSCNHPVRSH